MPECRGRAGVICFMYHLRTAAIIVFVAVLFAVGAWFSFDAAAVTQWLKAHPVSAPIGYFIFLIISVVAAPFSSLPLVPFAVGAWGVAVTSVLNSIGWWVGALLAFELARLVGRPLLRHVVSLERVERWVARLSGRATFFSIVLLRTFLPVEIPSYALGLIQSVERRTHAIASLIGIIPLAILWTALGGAVVTGAWLRLVLLGLIIVAVMCVAWLVWRR